MFTVDAALQHTCAVFREQAERGEISAAERDLLTDGAILLAMHIEELAQDARGGEGPPWPEAVPSEAGRPEAGRRPQPAGRHERHRAA